MKIQLTKPDMLWSYLGTCVSLGANLLLLPLPVVFLEGDALGLWYVFTGIGSLAALFDFGFSITFARNIAYCWSGAAALHREQVALSQTQEPDYGLMKNILAACRMIYGLLAAAVPLLLLTLGSSYIRQITPELQKQQTLLAWNLYALAVFANLYYGYFHAFLRGVGAVAQANRNTVLARLAQLLVTVLTLVLGWGLVGASLGYVSYGLLFRWLSKRSFFRYQGIGSRLSQEKSEQTLPQQWQLITLLWHNAWQEGVIALSNFLCTQAATLLCARFLTLEETGAYSLGMQVAAAVAQIAATRNHASQPSLQSAYAARQFSRIRQLLARNLWDFFLLFLLGTLGVFLAGLPVLHWLRPGLSLSPAVMLGLLLYHFVLQLRNCYTSYFASTNRILYRNGFLFSALLCSVLSYLMMGPWGLSGLLAAQLLSQLVYNVWKWPTLAHRELDLSWKEMWNLWQTSGS